MTNNKPTKDSKTMSKQNPETDLIAQLTSVRQALTDERESLLARVAVIEAALGVTPAAAPAKARKVAPKTPKAGGIREAITAVVSARPNLTIKEIQAAVDHPASSVEATVRAMASAGKLSKDESSLKKFSLPVAAPVSPTVNGKSNGKAVHA
jgi:hypothetical protein